MDQHSYRYAEPLRSVALDKADQSSEHWLETTSGRILGITALVVVFALVGGFDYADQVAAQAREKQERAARVKAYAELHAAEPVLPLSHPCGATIRDGMTSVTMGPERCVRVREGKR